MKSQSKAAGAVTSTPTADPQSRQQIGLREDSRSLLAPQTKRLWRVYDGGPIPHGWRVTELTRTYYANRKDVDAMRLTTERVQILVKVRERAANDSKHGGCDAKR